ncbi:MAG: HAMP domain-containing sensor histidine kinase [Gloeomargarita sp. SKYBB_i_bin120]|nr:HAMP domain-containing histidine kinase [Gloeomargarita sp. SKYG98]MCS7293432.1 HAMP domain-containing histidine kinase [Gloeomargarita sp. SKYB120]MDW8178998.1 HAMP domain-containing sensor histidine kinase [Gloeomargarita sp. SKYBB_i_bin120]
MAVGWLSLGVALGLVGGWWLRRWLAPKPTASLPWPEILHQLPWGCLVVDEDNQLLWCNPAAQALLRLRPWRPGQPRLLLELVRSYELDQLIERARNQAGVQTMEWTFYPAELTQPPIPLRAMGQRLSTGEVVVFLENRQALVELTQARDRWITDLTHELKTPLTAMQLVAEALYARVDPPLQTWVSRLLGELQRLSRLVHNWLEMAQGHQPVRNPTPVNLPALVQNVWQSLEPLAQQKNLRLDYVGPSELWLPGDELRLYQMLCNLLDNSIKYSPVDGVIRLVLTPQTAQQQVQIDILDQGPGFPPADLPHLFERFYQGQNHPQGYPHGTGLGLAIVRQIVQAHGGEIQAANHPEQGGAWVRIQLPWSAEALPLGADPTASAR